jgi:catechol 2,3-dioxygenase-like lactoylglutathione lyase family enzyme
MTAFREAFPIVYVDDVPEAIAFYEAALGFATTYRWPAEGDATFAFLRLDPLGIAVSARASATDPTRDFELCVYTDDADAAAEQLRANGAGELQPPRLEPWGERRAYFRAPDGTLLHIAQPA